MVEQMLAPGRAALRRWRESGDWPRPEERRQLWWALQADHQPGDLPLVRWLHTRSHDLGDELRLAGYLLALHRQPADVWLHLGARRSSFDAACGYERGHLGSGGVSATRKLVASSGHPLRAEALELLDGLSDEEVDAWRHSAAAEFSEPDALTWSDRAWAVGDHRAAEGFLAIWAEQNPAELGTLQHRLAELGEFAQAARLQRQIVERTTDSWDRAGALGRLVQLERQAGNLESARVELQAAAAATQAEAGWEQLGLGRMLVEEAFLLAEASADPAVFVLAERLGEQLTWRPLVLLEAALAAAGDERRPHYQALIEAERGRLGM